MTQLAVAVDERSAATRWRFVATICAGSFLLFLIQPMIARMALPRLGGAPAVWNSAMLVYQALLLGGYAYAHWLGRFAPRRQAMVHLALFAVAATMLPIGLIAATPPPGANSFVWVPWLLLVSIGPLFLVVAAQAPLLQRWFAISGGGDPYPLYAASNLGSFSGLIAYPLLVEPFVPVAEQSVGWSLAYGALVLLVAWCAWRLPTAAPTTVEAVADAAPPVSRRSVWTWIFLAAIPSGLMLSTTLHLTTDIVAMPLLWVIPLGLYLLSFSVAFSENRRLAGFFTRIAPFVLLVAACGAFNIPTSLTMFFAYFTLLSLFAVSVVFHGALFERRPAPVHLTRFYLAMSVGGVLGGLFCALIAPLIFNWTYEHPLLMLASAVVVGAVSPFAPIARRWADRDTVARFARWGFVLLLFVSLAAQEPFGLPTSRALVLAVIAVLFVLAVLAIGNRWLFVFAVGALMLGAGGWDTLARSFTPGEMTRSFFGVYTVSTAKDGTRVLVHGTTVHGVERRGTPELERSPTTYYVPGSGVGLALTAAPALFGDKARIGVVGLGTGTLACYARPGQRWTIYEIDPAIADIARSQFSFLSRCLPTAPILIGDARLTLEQQPDNSADILIIDAFSSDAVPLHLLTREAFATYRRHLAPNGLLMVHITNRFLTMEPVIAAAASAGWSARLRRYKPDQRGFAAFEAESIWIVLSPSPDTIARLTGSQPWLWRPLKARPGFSPWTDDHASILSVLR